MPTVRLRDHDVHFTDSGGDAPAVLCLHNALLDGRVFDPVVAALGDSARVVCPDLPGFGQSPIGPGYDVYALVELQLALLDHLGLDRAIIVACGFGGLVAVRAALRHPRRVAGLVLVGVQYDRPDELTAAGYRAMSAGWTDDGPDPELADALAHAVCGPDDALSASLRARWRAMPRATAVAAFELLAGADPITDRLIEIRCPARVLHGARDEAVPREVSARLAARLVTAGPVELVDAPHLIPVTRPDAIAAAIRAVIDDTTR